MNRIFSIKNFPALQDISASLVVFVVAIPLTLGISIASGAPVEAGIMSAVIGGIIVGLLSGAPLMVSGPAAGLSAIILQLIQNFGINGMMMATFFCGFFQVFFSLLKAGPIFKLIPESILNGMLAAIGSIIIIGQIQILLGHSISIHFVNAIYDLPKLLISSIETPNLRPILMIGLAGLFIQFFWNKLTYSFTKKIPAALVNIILLTFISQFFIIPRVSLTASKLFSETIIEILNNEQILNNIFTLIGVGLMLCLVASAESLLTARAIGQLDRNIVNEIGSANGEKTTEISSRHLNKELCAQGLGNIICGFFGAIPVTGVILRSAANIQAGAKSRWSTILHGLWVLLFIYFLTDLITLIPLAALASVLIFTGWKLLGIQKMKTLFKNNKFDFMMMLSTLFLILMTNLLKGIIFSICLYYISLIIFNFYKNNKPSIQN